MLNSMMNMLLSHLNKKNNLTRKCGEGRNEIQTSKLNGTYNETQQVTKLAWTTINYSNIMLMHLCITYISPAFSLKPKDNADASKKLRTWHESYPLSNAVPVPGRVS